MIPATKPIDAHAQDLVEEKPGATTHPESIYTFAHNTLLEMRDMFSFSALAEPTDGSYQ